MLSTEDRKFIQRADKAIRKYGTIDGAATALGMNAASFYTKIRRCGYRIVRHSRLEPVLEVLGGTGDAAA